MELADVAKTVTVEAPAEEAFRILVEKPDEWMPPGHTFITGPEAIVIEPGVGGRFYERGADGREVVHGVILAWAPPERLVMTWRMGANWQPIDDDDKASRTEFTFVEAEPGKTKVVLTHSEFERHGEAGAAIRAAVDGPSPGETLARYAETVDRNVKQG
ncbi:SRPBCC family protein [Kibdelosporangium lantanae]